MPRNASVRLALIATLLPALALHAQQNAGGVTPQGSTRADPTGKKVLGLADIARWKRINGTALSPDGKWLTYGYTPNEGDDTLFVKGLDGTKLYTIPGGSGAVISDDSKHVGYFVTPPRAGAGRGGRAGGGGRGAAVPVPFGGPARRFELLDLATGDKFDVPEAATFKFAKGAKFVAVRANKANASAKQNGADLVLRELTSGISQNIGNVNLYDFDDDGRTLAYTVDAADRSGNGVYVIDLATSQSKALNTASLDYDQLTWGDKNEALAVLRGDKKKENLQRDNTLLVWKDVAGATPAMTVYDPSKDANFPKAMVVSELGALRWGRDGSRVFIGLKEQEPDPSAATPSGEPRANVDVWHWKDAEVQSVQMIRIAQERRSTLPAAFDVGSGKLVRISDEVMRNVAPSPDPRWALGRIDTTYRTEVQWGGSKSDLYRVSTTTGERSLIERGVTRTMGSSPDGKYYVYLKDKKIVAYNNDTGKNTLLGAADKIDFIDATDDHPYERPTYGVAGWSKDGKSLIVNHRYDLYSLPLDGGKATNLTGGVGDAGQIVFRLVRLDRAGGGGRGGRGGAAAANGDEEDQGVDLSKPQLLSAYGQWTKKSGYYTLNPGAKPTPLLYDDESIGQAQKASQADRVVFTRQTFTESPDLWVTTTSFVSPTKVTDANPFITDYAWGSKKLIDFKNSKGQRLQGTLTLPANYQPGKKYPMLVYFYELLSNTHHQFAMPAYDDRPHFAEYASDGYLVFEPDIVYQTGKPGTSALDCVTSGVKEVIKQGFADPKHIGIQGHSWGGYETSFILTQTDMFAAVVTGAPPSNLVSFYDETYPGTGTLQQGIVEVGQVRMGTNPWENHQLFEEQSAVYNVRNIKTPFLILHGTADNAVDWHQGLELYGAAKRWGKQVILLSYPGEPHHLARKENQKDFQLRMKQFFDHYLKDTPSPRWMIDGVSQVEKPTATP
ncbi:MAG TPA: prolyl oligopeptidase family serine peptidase [Gemmatimonadaceae bacterium]|jgi:dienelactone hydrolase